MEESTVFGVEDFFYPENTGRRFLTYQTTKNNIPEDKSSIISVMKT